MNICVFCSSRDTVAEKFRKEARTLGHFIGAQHHNLVYGGATGGLMSEIAKATHSSGGKITGVIPSRIVEMGRESLLVDLLFKVETMSERKDKMRSCSDVFVVLPGGYGTLDELFDTLSSSLVGYHHKPTILVNSEHFYDALLTQFNIIEQEHLGHIKSTNLHIASSSEEAISIISELLP